MIITDGITAVGVEPIDVTNIDAILAGSQKALMLPRSSRTTWNPKSPQGYFASSCC